ncbi:centromere/kinetochore protein zw10 homolog [Acanthaster planci]|uniref:Centromere/kinetochore protein zw10 homolog n=1 Tax=Acanthaster planci TaxID=133434 RepID=A0A8B7YKW3_ACAPL|nr:centromere/kinetochore protein zw10 homolog [Acanthaster planci]
MASLVTDVLLANTDLLEKEDLGTRIGKLSAHIDEIKGEIYHAVHEKYANFRPTRDSTQELHSKVQALTSEMETLSSKIKGDISSHLNSSTSDLHDLTRQLEKTNAIIEVLQSLCKVNGLLTGFQSCMQTGEYVQAADIINALKFDLDVLIEDGYCELKIVKALRSELRVNQEMLLHRLGEAWTAMVIWNVPHAKDPVTMANVNQVQLKLIHSENAELTVTAMNQVGILKSKMEVFAKKLIEYILKPLVMLPSVTPAINAGQKSQSTTIAFKVLPSRSEVQSDPIAVYRSIHSVLKALSGPLLGLRTEGKNGDESTKLTAMLGELVWSKLSKCIITNCLVHSIPTSTSKLNEYKSVITATEAFEASLRKTGFITETASPLLTYARDVNVHFANKKCQELIVEARKLMKRELHNTKRVGSSTVAENKVKGHKEDTKEKNHVSEGIFALPECAVSESVECLVNLAYQTLQEAASNTPQCAIQLFYTVRNMFEIFCDVVPTYHRDSLEKLPQLCALHHNNCMYIAHHLLTLGHQYRQSLPPPLRDGLSTFVDLIPVFRKLASQCFLAQMRTQRDQLLESLVGAEGFDQVATDDNFVGSERAIKQVLHQLGHLQRVWTDILPSNVYTKAMSTLTNTVLKHIVEKVTSLEDISADDAQQLYSLLSGLQENIPHLIKPGEVEEPVLVQSTVDQWTSFSELLFVLDASMQDIVDRWAEGKGPLALAFSASEVKSLMRAIFQNTDRRATALAKIR